MAAGAETILLPTQGRRPKYLCKLGGNGLKGGNGRAATTPTSQSGRSVEKRRGPSPRRGFGRAGGQTLRRSARRYSSQRDEFHLCFDASALRTD